MQSIRTLLTGTTALAGICLFTAIATPAMAQQQPVSANTEQVQEVVVTGSRIKRRELSSTQPIQTITAADVDNKGFTNVADALNAIPTAGVGVTPTGDANAFSTGRNFVNLFNLGSQRTLTVINGRRVVGGNPSGLFTSGGAGMQVDFNTIPTAFIDKIETIQAGGAAVYGSDAIAGVVNVVLKKRYTGAELDAQYGVSSKGDAENYRLRASIGESFFDDRLNLAASYEFNETKALLASDRDYLAQACFFAVNPLDTGPKDGAPAQISYCDRRNNTITAGGALTDATGKLVEANGQFFGFNTKGGLVGLNSGIKRENYLYSGGDGLYLPALTALQTPVKRHLFTAMVNYDLSDDIHLSSSVFYNTTDATEPVNQPVYNTTQFGGIGTASGALRLSLDNPFLTPDARAAIAARLPAGATHFGLNRASSDLVGGNNATDSTSETLRVNAAVDGRFTALERDFNWNLFGSYGQSEGSFSQIQYHRDRFGFALDATKDASGKIVCADITARANGCQPLNLFGNGVASKEALAYIRGDYVNDFEIRQTLFSGTFGGDLVELPAGWANFSTTYEYRKEEASFTPNEFAGKGLGRSAAIAALDGGYTTKELSVELLAPLVSPDFKWPLVYRLEAEGAYRKIDNSLAGKDEAWTLGLRWYPVEDLMIRAQQSRAFRAPAILELFLPSSTAFRGGSDPCDKSQITAGPSPATRRANCVAAFKALGLTETDLNGFTSSINSGTVRGLTGGNKTLKNEVAESWSLGFVYQPQQVKNLAISFDWVNIDILNAITNPSLTGILSSCYDSGAFPNQFCSRILRDKTGNLDSQNGFNSSYINAGYMFFQGLTLGVTYRTKLDDIAPFSQFENPGNLAFAFNLYNLNRDEASNLGNGSDLVNYRGTIGEPTVKWNLDTTWTRGPISASWKTSYAGEAWFNRTFTGENRAPLKVKAHVLNDLAVKYTLRKGLDARVIVNNVFDAKPPLNANGAAVGVYDLTGRYILVGLNAKF